MMVVEMWAGVAGRWAEQADEVDQRGGEVTAAMLARAAPAPGERVLELACGPGGAGLAAAALIGEHGEAVLSDVVPEMAAIAAARAAERGLGNVRTAVLDLERIDQADASYDVVLCREGLMFAADPGEAACEIHRVLRPGGRAAVAVWGPRAENPWLALVLDAVGAELGMPVPPPGVPGPFSLDDRAALAGLLARAGLADVVVEDVVVPHVGAGRPAGRARRRPARRRPGVPRRPPARRAGPVRHGGGPGPAGPRAGRLRPPALGRRDRLQDRLVARVRLARAGPVDDQVGDADPGVRLPYLRERLGGAEPAVEDGAGHHQAVDRGRVAALRCARLREAR
jgi:SAM-dependent methyltransferase